MASIFCPTNSMAFHEALEKANQDHANSPQTKFRNWMNDTSLQAEVRALKAQSDLLESFFYDPRHKTLEELSSKEGNPELFKALGFVWGTWSVYDFMGRSVDPHVTVTWPNPQDRVGILGYQKPHRIVDATYRDGICVTLQAKTLVHRMYGRQTPAQSIGQYKGEKKQPWRRTLTLGIGLTKEKPTYTLFPDRPLFRHHKKFTTQQALFDYIAHQPKDPWPNRRPMLAFTEYYTS